MRHCFSAWLVIVFLGVCSVIPPSGWAEEPSSKRELVLELLDLTGGGDMANRFSEVILSSMRTNYSAMVERVVTSQKGLTDAQRAAFRQRLSDRDRFFSKFSTRLFERVNFDETLAKIHAPLYEKHFTEDELRQMLAFQSSPVGRKATSIMPQLLQEGMAATMQSLQPIVSQMAGELFAEEQAIALSK